MQPLRLPNWTRGILFTVVINRVMTAKWISRRQRKRREEDVKEQFKKILAKLQLKFKKRLR